jgi:hypothetical protein
MIQRWSGHVAWLVGRRNLKPSPNGSITPAAVEQCREGALVVWQVPGAKSGQKTAAQAEEERKDRLWRTVGAKTAGRGYQGWQGRYCRDTYLDLKAYIRAVGQRLMGD